MATGSERVLISGGGPKKTENEKSKGSTSGSKPIFLQSANAYAMHGYMQGCRLPTELVYTAHERAKSYFPMPSPSRGAVQCCAVCLSVRTPHPMPKFIDRQGQGQGGPWTVQMNTGGCSPAQLPHWDDGGVAARSMDVNVRRHELAQGSAQVCLMSRLYFRSHSSLHFRSGYR